MIFDQINAQVLMIGNVILVSSVTNHLKTVAYDYLLSKTHHRNMSLSNQKKVANIICNGENYF